jgi:methylmalonyl-CoA mutase N-terminal domain/subunit
VKHCVARGLDVDTFAPRLSFFFNAHQDFFEEVAKYRAARRLWARELKRRFNPKKQESFLCRFHVQTAGCTLMAQQPENNIVRVAYQAMAAVLGGCQSLHTNGFDEALALPTEESARLALRTQQILAYETGVTKTVDPLAGSFYVENLTAAIEEKVLGYLQDIENRGGVIQCLETGFIQSEISSSAYRQQRDVESGEWTVVGVNKFIEDKKKNSSLAPKLLKVNDQLGREREQELKLFRTTRDSKISEMCLKNLETAAREARNTMPLMIKAVEVGCTLGEISDVFRNVFGTQVEWTGV